MQQSTGLLRAKMNDLNSRSCRFNLRIVGIKEGEENSSPTDFVSKMIPKAFGQDNFSRPVKIDRAQWSLRPKPQPNERVIITRVHNEWDALNILRLSRQHSPLRYLGNMVSIFPDYTAEVLSQQQAFNNVKRRLTEAGAKFSLHLPAKLLVDHNNTSKTFVSVANTERFANSLDSEDKSELMVNIIFVALPSFWAVT